jgi:hypothetical protein
VLRIGTCELQVEEMTGMLVARVKLTKTAPTVQSLESKV